MRGWGFRVVVWSLFLFGLGVRVWGLGLVSGWSLGLTGQGLVLGVRGFRSPTSPV